jgi:hypothetical protein
VTAEPAAPVAPGDVAPSPSRTRLARAVGAWAIGAAIFFRTPLATGFGTITGDEGDARLVTFLHEHWWQTLRGDATWDSPPIFHPTTGTIAYADTFVLDLVLYVPLRIVGVPPLVAFQCCLIALTAIGFASMYRLLYRHVGLAEAPSLVLAAVASFANNLYVDTGHAQMYAACVVPLVALLAVESWVAPTPRRRMVIGGAAGAVLGLLTWSSFYIGWFAIVIGLVALVVVAVVQWRDRAVLARASWERRGAVAGAAGGFVAMIVPFVATYASALGEGRGRSYDEVAGLAPRPFDLVNVGDRNVVWGRIVAALTGDDGRLELLHRAVAITPLLAASTVVGGIVLVRRSVRHGWSPRRTAGVVAAVTAVLIALLPIQFGFGGAWAWFHRLVPGGSAIRVYGRISVVNGFVAVLAAGCLLAESARRSGGGTARRLTLVLVALLAIEQVNLTDRYRELDRAAQDARFAAVPTPPEWCRSFHLVPESGRDPDHASIDAMWIAQRTGVPTVNGYSGWQPDGWALRPDDDTVDATVDDTVDATVDATYEQRVAGWVTRSDLAAVHCTFDAATRTWR